VPPGISIIDIAYPNGWFVRDSVGVVVPLKLVGNIVGTNWTLSISGRDAIVTARGSAQGYANADVPQATSVSGTYSVTLTYGDGHTTVVHGTWSGHQINESN
jgi:hypothetical protein